MRPNSRIIALIRAPTTVAAAARILRQLARPAREFDGQTPTASAPTTPKKRFRVTLSRRATGAKT